MFKLALILGSHPNEEREEQFYDSKAEAEHWKNFYLRTNPFVDSNNHPLSITNAYVIRMSR